MIRTFGELPPAPWKLYYLSQAPATTAFLDELGHPDLKARVRVHHDYSDAAQSLDLWPVLEKPNPGPVYCCGPRGLMDAVRELGRAPCGRRVGQSVWIAGVPCLQKTHKNNLDI